MAFQPRLPVLRLDHRFALPSLILHQPQPHRPIVGARHELLLDLRVPATCVDPGSVTLVAALIQHIHVTLHLKGQVSSHGNRVVGGGQAQTQSSTSRALAWIHCKLGEQYLEWKSGTVNNSPTQKVHPHPCQGLYTEQGCRKRGSCPHCCCT